MKHKSHIEKVMFICAQARPRFVGGKWWDGKVGIWPVGKVVYAQRRSANREAGTPEWENVNVDKDVYRELLLSSIVPAIADKWPSQEFDNDAFQITIQQDGAKAHIKPDDDEWLETLEELGFEDKTRLVTQPANSLDTNLNDLGFFNALQSEYYSTCPRNQLELIDMVKQCYEDFDRKKINWIWLTLQTCLNCIIDNVGDNNYKIPHMNKEKLERENKLPRVLPVTENARYYIS